MIDQTHTQALAVSFINNTRKSLTLYVRASERERERERERDGARQTAALS